MNFIIPAWVLVLLVAGDMIAFILTSPMTRPIRFSFILARAYFLIFYLCVMFGLVTDEHVLIALGRITAMVLFLTELLVLLAHIIGGRHANPK